MDELSEPSRLDAISTRWSLLRNASEGDEEAATAARNALAMRYMTVIRRYVGALLRSDQDADDFTQDVVVRLLSGDFASADPKRGRFRDFLKTAVRNMVFDRLNKRNRRRTADLDVATLPVAADEPDDDSFVATWRESVLDLVWKALEQQERAQRGSSSYTLLKMRADFPNEDSEQLATRYSAKIGQSVRADAVRQKLRRARMLFADVLIVEIAKGLKDPTPEKIEEELVALKLIDLVRSLLPEDWKDKAK